MGRKGEGDAGLSGEEGTRQAAVGVVGRERVGEAALLAVEGQDVRHPVRADVGPEFLFGEKTVGAGGDADDADARHARVPVQRTVQPRPLEVPRRLRCSHGLYIAGGKDRSWTFGKGEHLDGGFPALLAAMGTLRVVLGTIGDSGGPQCLPVLPRDPGWR